MPEQPADEGEIVARRQAHRREAVPQVVHPEISKARRPGHEQRRVNVDFPVWMIESLDREASLLGVPRQSLIKVLIARHLEGASTEAP